MSAANNEGRIATDYESSDAATSMQPLPSPDGESQDWWEQFQDLLDEQTEWPTEYLFKFIVPRPELPELKEALDEKPDKERASRKGNYVSVTMSRHVTSSDEVIDVYQSVAEVEDVIAL
jgi:putative lipoic acid-binding regulatory protein